MDFALDFEQMAIRDAARDFLDRHWPNSLVREMETDEKGYSPDIWRKMADLGWLGLSFPVEYGGTGSSFFNLVSLIEELGRALLVAPFFPTVCLGGMTILEMGNESQKQKLLPKIAEGNLLVTMALTEPNARYDADGITLTATDGSDYILNGTKLFVPDARIADYIICVARAEKGITLFLVDSKSEGISYTLLKTIGGDKQYEVAFDNVRVTRDNILGELGRGWDSLQSVLRKALICKCAEMVGSIQKILEMTVGYAQQRIQFDKPIGSFQAIQHKCADMLVDVDGARYLTYQAAWRLNEGLPADMDVDAAKVWSDEAAYRICIEVHQIHGGIGLMMEHDLQLYTRRLQGSRLTLGDACFYREALVNELGL